MPISPMHHVSVGVVVVICVAYRARSSQNDAGIVVMGHARGNRPAEIVARRQVAGRLVAVSIGVLTVFINVLAVFEAMALGSLPHGLKTEAHALRDERELARLSAWSGRRKG